MLSQRVYLDYAAATPLDSNVAKAMQAADASFANPSASYKSGRESKSRLDDARKSLAMFLGASIDEIVITSGASESNNLAIMGVAQAAGKGEIISSLAEHSSIREPLKKLEKYGYTIHWCPLDKHGRVDKSAFAKLLNANTVLVSFSLANSEVGTIEEIAKLSEIIRAFEKDNSNKIVFHTDASAAALTLNCSVARLGVDLLTLSSAKIYGPAGVGLLYVQRGTKLEPLILGGKQELGLRAGSESLPLVIGFAKAVEVIVIRHKEDEKHFGILYDELSRYCQQNNFQINGDNKRRLRSIVNISFEGTNGEDLVAYLDSLGFEVSTGAACEATNSLPSQALLTIGLTQSQAQGSLRVSFGRDTTPEDIIKFTKSLDKTLEIIGSIK